MAWYDPHQRRAQAIVYGEDPAMTTLLFYSPLLFLLGYPDHALQKSREALTLARELAHAHSMAFASFIIAWVHVWRREPEEAREHAEAVIALATEQGLPFWLALGPIVRGWALAEQGEGETGIAQIRQGITAYRATGAEENKTNLLALLAEACGKAGQREEGLRALAEALEAVERTGERWSEAELYRLKGELLLTQEGYRLQEKTEEAEACFLKAIDIARKQRAKSLELRATVSLARLWQQQGKQHDAHKLLSDVYNWFTEGFDTKDLQEAKALLEELH